MPADKYQIDMCHGTLLGKIILFTFPLMVSYMLQILFNCMDLMVIGHFAPHESLAAVGATLNINSLIINLFVGLSIGSNVLAARYYGAKEFRMLSVTTHTTITVAIFGGVGMMIIGLLIAKPLLVLLDTPPEVLRKACIYLWFCICGIPFIMLYNFGCAILRAAGDTRRPLYYLIIAGIVNVLLNLFFVIVCKMDVAGVAIATSISHAISAMLVVLTLRRAKDALHLNLRKLHLDWHVLGEMLRYGVPAGIQSACFSISNMTIQSSINSFGSYAMAGNAAVMPFESITYMSSYAFHQSVISFVSQNVGGRQPRRILNSICECAACGAIISTVLGMLFYIFGEHFIAIINPDPQVIQWGIIRMKILFTTYVICSVMDSASGALRGLGYAILPMLMSLFGACVFRIWWVFTIFPRSRTMENLLLSYPVSWVIVSALNVFFLVLVLRRVLLKMTIPSVPPGSAAPHLPNTK